MSDASRSDKHDDGLEFRLRFLQLTEADAQLLRSLIPRFRETEDRLVDEFYGHLREFPFTAAFLENPERFARLQDLQRRHFLSLLEANWGDDYAASRRRVGDVHAEVGIEPQYFIGAYYQYVQHCLRYFFAEASPAPTQDAPGEKLAALLKTVFLDIGLALDAYFLRSTLQVKSALDLLWKVNQELRQFAQLTTHDLKTPLATVANLCEETLDEFGPQLPDEARKLIDSARQRVFRMSKMIDDLLKAALTSHSTESMEEVELERIVAEVVERLKPLVVKKRQTLSVSPRLPKVWGNSVRLCEAIYNVVSNAVNYSPADVGRITVWAEVEQSKVRISVADNGPGIPKDELAHIFAPFRRLANKREQPGTGLGLYFARNLVEALGGRVWVESEVGGGSTFHIELNRTDPNATRK